MRNVTETDRKVGQNYDSSRRQSGASKATKGSGRPEPRDGQGSICEVHKLPMGEGLYTLAAVAKRCHAKLDVEDYVITYDEWPDKLDASFCPKHYCQLRESKLVVLETTEECAQRVAKEETGAQGEGQRNGRSLGALCAIAYVFSWTCNASGCPAIH